MGREVKRVALDFQWPLRKVWQGFINPHYEDHYHECGACKGTGASKEAQRLSDQWYGSAPFSPADRGSVPFEPNHPVVREMAERNVSRAPEYYGEGSFAIEQEARRLACHFNKGWMHHLNEADVAVLVAANRLMDLTHTWSPETRWQPKNPPYLPTAAEVNAWSLQGMGHDSINQWVVVKAECARLGIVSQCSECEGEGSIWTSPEAKLEAELWESKEPPSGKGYQIWETVSEGSPVSPVFDTPEALAAWMAQNAEGVDKGTSYSQWLAFIQGPGWAPSFIGTAEGLVSGVQGAVAATQ